VRIGNLVYCSGQIPMRDGELISPGQVGAQVTPEEANRAAQQAALNCLAALTTVIGDLNQVKQVVRVTGYVNSAPGFTGQPAVVNGASDLFVAAFGDAGRHSRTAFGVAQLPLGSCVEIDMIVEVGD
jgi:enamine deaminase RidA (YjgF/YER057c/UK114 family)